MTLYYYCIVSTYSLLICISHVLQVFCYKDDLKVIFALNAGGYDHVDKDGIHYEADFLTDGIASDYGYNLLMIGRVPEQDEILYKTERYHTKTFGYDLPLDGDGQYALVLKFCEVYFNKPNKKVFDVILNGKHEIVSQLDIFAQVGRGTAHEEYIFFNVIKGKLIYKGQSSEVRKNRVHIDFVKGRYDNPKINAFVLFKGNVEHIPRLKPLNKDAIKEQMVNDEFSGKDKPRKSEANKNKQIKATVLEEDEDDDDDDIMDADMLHSKRSVFNNRLEENVYDDDEDIIEAEMERSKRTAFNKRFKKNIDDDDEFSTFLKTENPRKPSGPRQPDPYSLDDTNSILLPVFIAIGAFIPLLFCLCKL